MTDGVDHEKEGTVSSETPEDPQTDDFVVDLDEIGMADLELTGARPMHVKLATSLLYISNRPTTYPALRLKREREYIERFSAYHVSRSEGTHILLIRSGDEEDGNGRSYQTIQHSDLIESVVRLVEQKGFELEHVRGQLKDDLEDTMALDIDEEEPEPDVDSNSDVVHI